jgi:DNA-directed RNA polymerase subunit delta
MAVKDFNGVPADELSMVEVARSILTDNKEKAEKFTDLYKQVESVVGARGDDQIAQFYTDLNTDGSFISLGENQWALRSWYPIDSINESIHEIDDSEEEKPASKPKKKSVNVFADDSEDDDVIDYNDDDPEDQDLDKVTVSDDEESPEDEEKVVEEIDDDEDDDLDDDDSAPADMALSEIADDDDLDDLGDGDEEK